MCSLFGTQSLIKDIISGIFILVDDQFNVGDTVKIGAHTGRVKAVSLRLTILEDKEGDVIYIPNSKINSVVVLKKE